MKTYDEIVNARHIYAINKLPVSIEIYCAGIDLYGFKGTVVFGFNEDGWEHVSVSHCNKHKLPTWEDMCHVKELFWKADETVVQIHPSEDAYVHGVPGMWEDSNVLHLWRPVGGDWNRIEQKYKPEEREDGEDE